MKVLLITIFLVACLVKHDYASATQARASVCHTMDYQLSEAKVHALQNMVVFFPCNNTESRVNEGTHAVVTHNGLAIVLKKKSVRNDNSEMTDSVGYFASNTQSVKQLIKWEVEGRSIEVIITGT